LVLYIKYNERYSKTIPGNISNGISAISKLNWFRFFKWHRPFDTGNASFNSLARGYDQRLHDSVNNQQSLNILKMKTTKRLGIWMDHSIAHLMELTNDTIVANTIESQSKLQEKEKDMSKDERYMLTREQNQLSAYFKRLSDVIKDYQEVVLFGPTSAKNELLNLLKENQLFKKIKIEVKPADKMTQNQRNAFVRNYFTTPE